MTRNYNGWAIKALVFGRDMGFLSDSFSLTKKEAEAFKRRGFVNALGERIPWPKFWPIVRVKLVEVKP